jgi:hypothetical protein
MIMPRPGCDWSTQRTREAAWRINNKALTGERMGQRCALRRCYRSKQSESGSAA